jgi:hypothetical protein
MAVLATFVAIQDDDGLTHSFGPPTDFDDLPGWAKKKVKNPKVLGEDNEAEDDDESSGGGDPDAGGPPPKSGNGSGEDKWRAYADEVHVDVSELKGRDAIIAALEAAGVRTE